MATARGAANAGYFVGGGSGYRRVGAFGAGPAAAMRADAAAYGGGFGSLWHRKSRRKTMATILRLVGRLRPLHTPRILALLLICVITYLLHSNHQSEQRRTPVDPPLHHRTGGHLPSITIFAAPSLVGSSSSSVVGPRQQLAVRSWLALSPHVSVILFGHHPSMFAFAAALGPRVSVESAIDFTFLYSPFFHTMVARTQASHSDVSVLIDPDIILLPDFVTILHKALQLDRDWILVSIPRSVSNFSFHLDDTGKQWLLRDGGEIKLEKLKEVLVQKSHLNHCSGRVLMAWNKGNIPLHAGIVPPFIYGKGFHNQWLINEALSSELRLVIDASETFSNFYQETLGHYPFLEVYDGEDSSKRPWESNGNSKLAATYGSIYFKPSKFSNIVKLVVCSGQYLLINEAEGTMYFLDSFHQRSTSVFSRVPDPDPVKSVLSKRSLQPMLKRLRTCVGYNSSPYREKCSISEFLKVNFTLHLPLFLPFSLESLLEITADEHKTIVLAVVGDSYRDMLMSWVCRLRHLSVTNFIIGALDSDIYQFSVLQGLPVFKDPLAPANISFNECHFGSECFPRVTKAKSRLVLQILKLGYNVLLSDADVYWFHNPLPYLHSFGPATLLAQSDEYNETGPINQPRRLNSGFYFARSDVPTISAMEKVVKHASTSDLSEQPSFYDVLCGEGGINRVGHDRCLEPETNLTILFLDRNLFPNGAFQGLWEEHDVGAACMKKGCLVLHNNWISGRKKKLERQVLSGLWAYNSSTRMCLQSWQVANS